MTEQISIAEIRKLIPNQCFEKSLLKSMGYMIRDLLLLSTAFWTHSYLPLIIFWNVYGFLMWCVFVVGHDCGHGSFSNYTLINDICGHICHTMLLVPYYPWRFSHWRHHIHHQHHKKDKSHPWWTRQEYSSDTKFNQNLYKSPIMPFIAYFMYLYFGYFDGSHVFPASLLYTNSNRAEQLKCAYSTFVLIIFLLLVFVFVRIRFYTFVYYGGCWIVFAFWLFMVTYLQHHSEGGSLIFNDENWSFIGGALETIDRCYGYGIDDLHHNISDCHVVHHLFFTKIPHYHLTKATNSITPYLITKCRYKYKKHSFVWMDFWIIFSKHHFIGQLTK